MHSKAPSPLIVSSHDHRTGFRVTCKMKWFPSVLSHRHGDQGGLKMVLVNVMKA